ncbi:MAG TPA: metallophosphoesterase, partial [bacterium]|nr:metallophosphoesterase [bacterium]
MLSSALIFLVVCCCACAVYAACVETRLVKIERITVLTGKKIPGPIRILHLSDLHFKRRDRWKTRFIERLAGEPVDLVMITGDSIDQNDGIAGFIRSVSRLRPAFGTYCVFGNHDYFEYRISDAMALLFHPKAEREIPLKDIGRLTAELESRGIHILHNRKIAIPELDTVLFGVDEFETGRDDIEKAAFGAGTETFNIMIAHHPDTIVHAPQHVIDLALAGHTHGGQVRMPLLGAFRTQSSLKGSRAAGLMFINGITTYVSRGLSHFTYLP